MSSLAKPLANMEEDDEKSKSSQKEQTENQGDAQRVVAYDDENGVTVQMSVWVWEEVLKFIRRMEMADRVSLVCHALKKLCWPRLHGDKVRPHIVGGLEFEKGKKEEENGQPKPTLTLFGRQYGGVIVPMATDSPPPDYIQGFKSISFRYVNGEVLKFVRNISPLMPRIQLHLFVCQRVHDAFLNLRAFLNILQGCHISLLSVNSFSFCHVRRNVPALLATVPAIHAIPITKGDGAAMNKLILARIGSGKTFALDVEYQTRLSLPFDAIRQLFLAATQPQSFFIGLRYYDAELELFQLENAKTGEVLALFEHSDWHYTYELYRCPSGEVQQWRAQAKKLLKGDDNSETSICYWMK